MADTITLKVSEAQAAVNAIAQEIWALEANPTTAPFMSKLHAAATAGQLLLVKGDNSGGKFQPQDGGTGKPPPPPNNG